MWFRSVFTKTLRDHRVAILGWGIGMGLVVVSPMATVSSLVTTPQARAELVALAQTFAWNADPIAVDTVGGYATFKIGIFMFLITVWPLLAGSRMLRGEEERGAMDVLLSLPLRRVRLALEKLAAMWAALFVMGVLIGLVVAAGGQAFKADFGLGDALVFGLDLALLCAVIGGLALLISQFTQERGTAAGITAALLLLFVVLDMVHRIFPGTEWVSRFSPIYYYNLSKPLISTIDIGGLLVLLVLSVGLGGVSVWLFMRRDIGATVRLPAWLGPPQGSARADRPDPALPEREWSLRSVYARSLGMVAMPTFWWTLGIAGFAAWMVIVVKQIETQMSAILESSPAMKTLLENLGGGKIGANATILSALFQVLPILLMAFAVTQVNRWTADEEDGRLDLVLSTPQSRVVVVLGRFAALATSTVIIGVVTLVVTAVGAQISGVALDPVNLAAATLGMIPLGLLIAAIGYLAAGWLRTAAETGLLAFLLAAWFLISFVGPELGWPDPALRLSPFYYYGTPLLHGIELGNVILLIAIGAGALALATLRFARKDINV
ncbi:MAG: ABC transporter permease subunit [Chloroflexota bacterium]|nr:ABC transporter permease subunit [Chloroflexota bacterium]